MPAGDNQHHLSVSTATGNAVAPGLTLADEGTTRDVEPAATSLSAWALFIAVAGTGLLADLWSKYAVFVWLGYGRGAKTVILIPNVLALKTTLNGGAVFGIGQGLALVFILVSLVAVGFVVYVFMSSSRRQWVMHIALGLILAGAMGNLYDRIFNHGNVRDFLMFLHYWPWIFNLADAMLCIGVPLLILCWGFQKPRPRRSC